MPELPEIETIKKELKHSIRGRKISSINIYSKKTCHIKPKQITKYLLKNKIQDIKRRAKLLALQLENKYYLVFHLKLTGQILYQKNKQVQLTNKSTRVILNFTDGSSLLFNDPRHFGWLKLMSPQEWEDINQQFGPEPLAKNFTFAKFEQIFNKQKKAIKPLLMDQTLLAGIGNIYSQEACFCASILPNKPANQISKQNLKKLYSCLRKILKLAIYKRGASVRFYRNIFGKKGKMVPLLKVYHRAGQKCLRCQKGIIKKMSLAGRSTYYCSKCQK